MTMKNNMTIDKLEFPDFMKAFRAQYEYGMTELRDFEIQEQVVHKNNKNLHGIIIRRQGYLVAPVFYYEDFYEAYKKGTTIEQCIYKMIDFVSERVFPNESLSRIFTSWEGMKELLFVKLINFKKNKEQLMRIPHKAFGDMAVVVQIYLDDPIIGKGAVMVDDALIDTWGIETKTLFDTAFENMKRYHIRTVNLLDYDKEDHECDKEVPEIYVVSYDAPFPGAAAMLQTQYLKEFATTRESDFYILPVSVHEILMIQKKEGIIPDMLINMLQGINTDAHLSDCMLSEEVFYLDRAAESVVYLLGEKELVLCDP